MAKTVAIYGGAFNPIHWGHLALALHMQQALRPDHFFLMPSADSPHKQVDKADQVSGEHRLAMCRLAAAELKELQQSGAPLPLETASLDASLPPLEVSAFEVDRGGVSYTVDTLSAFSQHYPAAVLFLVMGGDMFLTVDKWRRAPDIFCLSHLVAAARTSDEHQRLLQKAQELEALGAHCRVYPFPVLELSSTQVREQLRSGQSLENYIPSSVAKYIEEHKLYC